MNCASPDLCGGQLEMAGSIATRAGRHKLKSAEMKEDGPAESFAVTKSTSHGFDFLNARVEGFTNGVR